MRPFALLLLTLFVLELAEFAASQNGKQQRSKQRDFAEDNEFAEFDSPEDEEDTARRKQKEPSKRAAAESESQQEPDRESQDEVQDELVSETEHDSEVEKHTDLDSDEANGEAFVELESDEFADIETGDTEEEAEAARRRSANKQQSTGKMNLQFTQVPANAMQSGVHAYLIEGFMIAGLMVFMTNYVFGKSRNTRIASDYITALRDLLEVQFSLVGDDPHSKEAPQTASEDSERASESGSQSFSGVSSDPSSLLIKETESVYRLWCSGRAAIEGALIELRLLKRQDLISVMHDAFVPSSCDRVHITVYMEREEMDSFVFAVAKKRAASRLLKDFTDISTYCPDKKNPDQKFEISNQFVMFSEIGEATRAFLVDSKVTAFFDKYDDYVEYVHFSDQYVGQKVLTAEEQSSSSATSSSSSSQSPNTSSGTELSEPKRALTFCFNLSPNGRSLRPEDVTAHRALLQFVFYCIERVRKIRLGKEAKQKADRNRSKAVELADRNQHAARQELAQQRKEEKRRADKEKLLNEDDPYKIKKLEEKQQKEERKMKQPKMKMMRIKGGFA